MNWKTLFAAACLTVLGGCAASSEPAPDLKRVWMLDEWPGFSREQLHQAKAEMNFTGLPNVSAYMGCNRMMFEADIADSSPTEGRLTIGVIASTRKLCADGMALEQDFGNRIGSFTRYRIEGHRLILENEQGETAEFVAQD